MLDKRSGEKTPLKNGLKKGALLDKKTSAIFYYA